MSNRLRAPSPLRPRAVPGHKRNTQGPLHSGFSLAAECRLNRAG